MSRALDEYERSLQRRKIVNVKAVMSTLRRGLAPFASREIGALTRKDLVSQIDRLEDAGLPGAATDLRALARLARMGGEPRGDAIQRFGGHETAKG